MGAILKRPAVAVVGIVVVFAVGITAAQGGVDPAWTSTFAVEPGELVSTGVHPYFPLEPGAVRVLAHGTGQLTITVLDETKSVAGFETRVVEERETSRGALVEVSRNYFAISRRTNAVFYFGEDVDMYANGAVKNHEGSWLAGVSGARFGLMLPGQMLMHARYYQEVAPGLALDRAEIVSLTETVETPAGRFTNVVKIEETTPLEPGVKEYKYYARDVGLVQDGDLKLVRTGRK